jgi:hypothetical protein
VTELAIAPRDGAGALAEKVVIQGDLSRLTPEERMAYYTAVCNSLGLNPLTRPFEYISLNGKLTLYATRAAADQLRAVKGITITSLDPRQVGDLFVVVATGRDRTGREDSSTGAVSTAGLRGEALANAMMKAETKAKRRLTLSLAGLGMTDETEVDSIPGAVRVESEQPLTLAERAAQARASIHATEATAQATPAADAADGASVSEPTAEPPAPTSPVAQEAPAEPVDAREAADGGDSPEPASALCGEPSVYNDGDTCNLAAGHRLPHRILDGRGKATASW